MVTLTFPLYETIELGYGIYNSQVCTSYMSKYFQDGPGIPNRSTENSDLHVREIGFDMISIDSTARFHPKYILTSVRVR